MIDTCYKKGSAGRIGREQANVGQILIASRLIQRRVLVAGIEGIER